MSCAIHDFMALKKIVNNIFNTRGHDPDKKLIITIGIILIFSLVMLASVSIVVAYTKFNDSYYYFKHQLFGLGIGLIAFWFFARIDYHYWRKYAFGFLIFSIFLLILVFIPGLSASYGKAQSWINVFGFSLQPSEFVKLFFLLYLAGWLESRGKRLNDLHEGIGPFVIILGIIAILMIMQPDIGTLFIIAVTSIIVYYIGGGRVSHILVMVLIGSLCFALMIHYKPYQMDRFKCMLNAKANQAGICYQVNQSLIAVGSGGLFGRGFGQSRQKFMYVPEVSGDSIFSIIAEEIGFIFSSLLVLTYFYLFYRGFLIAKHAKDDFGKILVIGIVSWIFVQAIINIGGMINLLPITGVPLPFVSYGGSSLLSVLAAMGIVVNISKQTR